MVVNCGRRVAFHPSGVELTRHHLAVSRLWGWELIPVIVSIDILPLAEHQYLFRERDLTVRKMWVRLSVKVARRIVPRFAATFNRRASCLLRLHCTASSTLFYAGNGLREGSHSARLGRATLRPFPSYKHLASLRPVGDVIQGEKVCRGRQPLWKFELLCIPMRTVRAALGTTGGSFWLFPKG
jgi:hypothetical protein